MARTINYQDSRIASLNTDEIKTKIGYIQAPKDNTLQDIQDAGFTDDEIATMFDRRLWDDFRNQGNSKISKQDMINLGFGKMTPDQIAECQGDYQKLAKIAIEIYKSENE